MECYLWICWLARVATKIPAAHTGQSSLTWNVLGKMFHVEQVLPVYNMSLSEDEWFLPAIWPTHPAGARKLKFANCSQQRMAPLFVQDATKRQTSHDQDSSTFEATITQLTNPVGDSHLFNIGHFETGSTNPLKGRRRPKRHATKMPAPCEATITQLTNTVWDAHLFNDSAHET